MSRAYSRIYVPVDRSGHSFAAIDLAIDLASRLGASLVGCHARTGSAASDGLELMQECCRTASIPLRTKSLDAGHRPHTAILHDLGAEGCDLVVVGALGEGAVPGSQIGSVAERIARGSPAGVVIVKDLLPDPDAALLAAVDGSAPSLRALEVALDLSRASGRGIEAIVVGEARLAGEASRATEAARAAAAARGVDLEVVVSEGKPFDRILAACSDRRPWLLALGRNGADALDDLDDLGSTAANLLRLASCNLLVVPGAGAPAPRARSAQAAAATASPPSPIRRLRWTEEAERLLHDLPRDQRPEVIRAVEEGARRIGITTITTETIDRVMLGYIDS